MFLARTIARPIHRLADAAEQVRTGHGRQIDIPDFSRRRDEIGNLSGSLRDMTAALWQRMDAIERFAADVAHEIKNPLTSLRSAVETVSRIEVPQQQKKLMGIILDDVERLNRLISDISDASRLDAELSRAETVPVDIANMLSALVELHDATADEDSPRIQLDFAPYQSLSVRGIEGRLVQVWRNLISNAVSFSPPRGLIRITAMRDGRRLRVLRVGRRAGHSAGQADGDLRPLLFRAAGGREVRHPFRPRSLHLQADRRGPWRPPDRREPRRRQRPHPRRICSR